MLLVIFGVLIEVLQYFTDYRTFSFVDMVADTVGILAYYLVFALLIRFPDFVFHSPKEQKKEGVSDTSVYILK